MRTDTRNITKHYASTLAERGVNPLGVLWPNVEDLATRFEILLEPVAFGDYAPERPVRLLDLGCGPGFLLDYLATNGLLDRVDYTGVDVTETTMGYARTHWPGQRFELRDVRDQPFPDRAFDYCVICGVFNSRNDNSFDEMRNFAEGTLRAVWPAVERGLAFNVMSKHVDWERDDLFHWPLDDIMAFCKATLSRHVAFRLDYGLWEAAALVSRAPARRRSLVPASWSGDAA